MAEQLWSGEVGGSSNYCRERRRDRKICSPNESDCGHAWSYNRVRDVSSRRSVRVISHEKQ